MERRYGDEAKVVYYNVQDESTRAHHDAAVKEIEMRGLLYPVTAVDGVLVYDGAVSYPAIMRAVNTKLTERQGSATA